LFRIANSADLTGLSLEVDLAGVDATCESFMKTLKCEEVYRSEYRNLAEARIRISKFLDQVYNQKRLHSSLGYRPPVEFERCPLPVGTATAAMTEAG
jgi:Integrase core domain